MSTKSKIQGTQRPGTVGRTWNPIQGCSLVSEGCTNCYAMYAAHRMASNRSLKGAYSGTTRMTEHGPVWTGGIRVVREALEHPLRWTEPSTVFVNSMSDLFHEGVPFYFIGKVMEVIAKTPQHTYIVLTKRPARMLEALGPRGCGFYAAEGPVPCPQPNLWLGVSVEHQRAADERIPLLLQAPAKVRFLSVEPLLERASLNLPWPDGCSWSPLTKFRQSSDMPPASLDWVIVGGESGPRARPCSVDWIRELVAQCGVAGVPVFVKQLGARPGVYKDINSHDGSPGFFPLNLRDRKRGDPDEWPEDLRIREWPNL